MVDVSVIIPCYNHGEFIVQAVESVLNQKGNFSREIIIINDGSTDIKTNDILKKFENPLIKVINQDNQGLARARNNGIRASRGKYILPLDSDNYLPNDFIQNNFIFLKKQPNAEIIYTDVIVFKDNSLFKKRQKPGEFTLSKMILRNYIDACMMYQRNVFDLLGGYDENMPYMGVEDWDFNIQAHKKGIRFWYNKANFFYYRSVPNSMIKKAESKELILLEYLIKKHFDLYINYIPNMVKEMSYAQRKPFLYFIKKQFM